MQRGRLVYVVGPSGAGKDSIIRYARQTLDADHGVVFAHRYITRPVTARGENHVALSPPEFALRKRLGLFALDWEIHGVSYGVGVELDAWLAQSLTVVVNGSRQYVPAARERYPRLDLVWVTAHPEQLAARLRERGRESPAQIEARLARNQALPLPQKAVQIQNDGTIEDAGNRFVALLKNALL